MATVDECRAALQKLAATLDEHAAEARSRVDLDRPLACTVRDLGVSVKKFSALLRRVGIEKF